MTAVQATPDDVKRLAALARIRVPEEALESFASEFDAILAYVGKLEALSLPADAKQVGPVRNVLRADTKPHKAGEWTEKLTEQFPKKEGKHLSVKQIISYE